MIKVKTNFKEWFKKAGIRAIRTFAQAALASIGTTAAAMGDVNWKYVVSVSVLSSILSLLTSVVSIPEVGKNDTSNTEKIEDKTEEE